MVCMKEVVRVVWCVAAWGGVSVATGSAGEFTVKFIAAITDYNDVRVTECIPEHLQYNLQPHQNVAIEVSGKNVPPITHKTCSTNKNVNKYRPQNSSNMTRFGHMDFTDVGNKSCRLLCIYDLQDTHKIHCHVQLQIGQDVDVYATIVPSVIDLIFYVGGNVAETKVHEVGFLNNTKLSLICRIRNNIYGNVSMIHRDKNGNSRITEIGKRNKYYTLNKTLNGDKIGCIVTNQTTNTSWETVVKLKYKEGTVEVDHENTVMIIIVIMCVLLVFVVAMSARYYCRRHRGQASGEDGARRASAVVSTSHTIEPRSSTPVSNDYAEVYNIVYEDRQRIERMHEARQQAIENKSRRPAPPPVDTIPVRGVQSSPPRPAVPLTTDSLIAPSDLYLLNTDSEGYEIPDELKFIPLQRNASEGDN